MRRRSRISPLRLIPHPSSACPPRRGVSQSNPPASPASLAGGTFAVLKSHSHMPQTSHREPDPATPRGWIKTIAGSRVTRLGLILALLVLVGGPAFAQDAGGAATPADAAAGGDSIPGSAWLLPFQSLASFEPVTVTILLCSILAITLIIQAVLRARRGVLLPDESTAEVERLINERKYRELKDFTDADDSFVSQSLNPALKRAPSFSDMREALETGVADQTAEEFRRLEYINILANVGPLLGLLGTVIGIMDAFLEMRRAGGSADVGALAGGISTALGTTMLGLILAIPCLIAYGILRNKVDRLTTEGALLAEEFLLMIKSDKSGGSSSGSSSAGSSSTPSRAAAPPKPAPAKAPARQATPA